MVSEKLEDLLGWLDALSENHETQIPLARADEVVRPAGDPHEITARRHAMDEARAITILPSGRNFH